MKKRKGGALPVGTVLMVLAVTMYFTELVPNVYVLTLLAIGFLLFTKGGASYLKNMEKEAKQVTEAAGTDAAETATERKIADLQAMRDAGLLSQEEYRYALKKVKGGKSAGEGVL